MTFLQMGGGLGASVFAPQGNQGSTAGTAAMASASGPRTIGQQAFGTVAGNASGGTGPGLAVLIGGPLALGLLVFVWWSLPR
jgi:hypothetical protein